MKVSLKPMANALRSFGGRHMHEILIGFGIASFSSAIVLGISKTPDALEDIRQATEEKGEALTKLETVKAAWKHYIPCGVSALSGAACLISSVKVSNKKLAALTTACQLTEANLIDLKEATKKLVGDKKAESICEEAAAGKVANLAPAENDILQTGFGPDIFYDPWSGRFFTCTRDRIDRAVALVNSAVYEDDSDLLNHFYYEIGLDGTQFGGVAGWTTERGQRLRMAYGYGPTRDGRACAVMDYDVHILGGKTTLHGTDMVQ